jgi:hypothetical protein
MVATMTSTFTLVSSERVSLRNRNQMNMQMLSQIAEMADRMLSFQHENNDALEPSTDADAVTGEDELPPRLIKEQSATGAEKDQTPDLELKHMLNEADEMGKELTKMDAHHDMLAKQLEIATAKQDHSDIKSTIANVVTTALARRSEQRQREIADIVDKVVSKLKVRLNACNKANKAMKHEIEEENKKRGSNATMSDDADAEVGSESESASSSGTGAESASESESESGAETVSNKGSEGEGESESAGEGSEADEASASTGGADTAKENEGSSKARFKGESEIVKAEAEREEDERIEREAHEELAADVNHSPKLRRLQR